jgi:hypothetical protein
MATLNIAMNYTQSTMNTRADGIPPYPTRNENFSRFNVEASNQGELEENE